MQLAEISSEEDQTQLAMVLANRSRFNKSPIWPEKCKYNCTDDFHAGLRTKHHSKTTYKDLFES
jgi:hypothetical protein